MMIGDRNLFGFEVGSKDAYGQSTFSMYVQGADVLEGRFHGRREKYCWTIDSIVGWLKEHLEQLMEEDPYPVAVEGESAAQLYANSFDFDGTEDEEYSWYTQVQDWLWRHSWVDASAGSYLATVFFRRIGGNMEISWDETRHPRVEFVNPKGMHLMDAQQFEKTVRELCDRYQGGSYE